MTTSNFIDIELVVSICWEALYPARYEILCAVVFFGGWRLGTRSKNKQKGKLAKAAQSASGDKWKSSSNRGTRPAKALGGKMKVDAKSFDGRLDCLDPALLKDPTWVIPQVVQLCQTQSPQALQMYQAAVQAGLDFADIPEATSRQLFASLVTERLRSGKIEDAMRLVQKLRQCGYEMGESLFASAIKLCTSKQLYAGALAFFDFVREDPNFKITEKAKIDKSIWSCLLFCALEAKAFKLCPDFFENLKACGTPCSKDFGNMLRYATVNVDWKTSLRLLQEMHTAGLDIDSVQYNTALATCVTAGKVEEALGLLDTIEGVASVADAITYNTIMKGCAKAGEIEACFKVFERMLSKNIDASQVTYGILLDVCINENHVDRAMQVFEKMTAAGCPMNTVLYTTLIKGFERAGDHEKALTMYKQMSAEPNVKPDLITFSILIKASCDNNRLEDALKLLEDMVTMGLKPDEVVFNNLIAGCALNGNALLGKQLFDDMIASGVRPSNATFSILIRVYHQGKMLDQAVEFLRTEPAKHKVELEPRIFLQLVQTCIRDRQGKRALEVYGLLVEHSTPTVAMHSSILTTCMKLNMYDTAADIVSMAVAHSARVDARDTRALLEAAVKKGKTQVAKSCADSMQALNHVIDAEFVDSLQGRGPVGGTCTKQGRSQVTDACADQAKRSSGMNTCAKQAVAAC